MDEKFNVEDLLSRLLEVRGGRPGRQVSMTEHEIKSLCTEQSIKWF